jgi:microcystin-dependent protein
MANMYNTRSQVNPTDFPINPATTSGVDLADILNRTYNTMMSNNAGMDRPLNIDRGGMWSQYDSQGNITLWMFNGTKDVEVGKLVSGVFTPYNSDKLQSQVDSIDTRVTNIEVTIGTAIGIPRGVITMWSGLTTNVPAGWVLCNGSNGTPDLRDKFIVGAGSSYNTQSQGGNATTVLGVEHMPSHNHGGGGTTSGTSNDHSHGVNDPSHSHSYTAFGGQPHGSPDGYSPAFNSFGSTTGGATTGISIAGQNADHTHTVTVNAEGGGQAFNNLPPYFALAYIMKT